MYCSAIRDSMKILKKNCATPDSGILKKLKGQVLDILTLQIIKLQVLLLLRHYVFILMVWRIIKIIV